MTSTLAVDVSPAPLFFPLLPGDTHLLRRGRPIYPGADRSKANRRGVDHDGAPCGWDGTYRFQSDVRLVRSLIYRARSQGVWTDDEILAQLLDPTNVGGGWLRCQEDPEETFQELLAACYEPRPPRHSAGQAAALVLKLAARDGGVRLADLQRAVRLGKHHRGNTTRLVEWLVARRYLREVRTYGPVGKVISVTVTRTRRGVDYKIASAYTRAWSVALHGLESLSRVVGHRSPQERITDTQTNKNDLVNDLKLAKIGKARLAAMYWSIRRAKGRTRGMAETARIKARREDELYEHPAMTATLDAVHRPGFERFVAALVADTPLPEAPAPEPHREYYDLLTV